MSTVPMHRQPTWVRAAAATLLAGLLMSSCDSVDRSMRNPNDPVGKHLRDWRDDVRGER